MKYLFTLLSLFFVLHSSLAQCSGTSLCAICSVDLTVTEFDGGTIINSTSTIDGTVLAGEEATGSNIQVQVDGCGEITLTVELDFIWEQGFGINWIHGVSFQSSAGWSAAEVVLPNDDWIFQNTITGKCFNNTFGPGYYYDPVGESCAGGDVSDWDGTDCFGGAYCEEDDPWLIDGDPSDNYGDKCEFNCPEFGFELSFCPQIAESNVETISFFITDDAQTGGWGTDDGCIFDLNFTIEFLPQIPEEVNTCEGECVTLDAGLGCDSYEWSTGETTPQITVCPVVETDYAITATSTNGCTLTDTITVFPEFCCEAMAGDLNGMDVCPGETATVTVSNFQTLPVYDEYLLLTDENGIVLDIVNGTSISFDSDVCAEFIVYAYNHYTGDGSTVPSLGSDVDNYDCINFCCDLVSLPVSFIDDLPPEFTNAPDDDEIDCIDNIYDAPDLDWTDNCGLSGTVALDEEDSNATLCEGGTITRTWSTVDSCGNETVHTQTINVLPLAPPEFIDPPADETQECTYTPVVPDLDWSNGLSDNCEDSGTVPGVLSGSHDVCGGEYLITWEYTDECDQLAQHIQTITIEPAPEATFINPPADISVECEDIESTVISLDYTNNLTGVCEISGSVDPVVSGTYDVCGGVLMNTWEFTDECGRLISHSQQITVAAIDDPYFIDPPADITVDCGSLPTASSFLNFTNGQSGECLQEGGVLGMLGELDPCTNSVTEEWSFVDVCGTERTHTRTISVSDLAPIEFLNVPAAITVSCDDVNVNIVDLDFSNNSPGGCLLEGTVSPVQSGSYNSCGGLIVLTWETTDACGTVYSATQDITVLPASEASFSNTPSDITVSCENIPDPTILNVTNGQTGNCLISDSVTPSFSENYTACGGDITETWNYTDPCGRSISASRTITVTEAEAPEFVNVPDDLTVSCDDVGTFANLLSYTNGSSGNCEIIGSTTAIQTGFYDVCGGELQQSWSVTDECGNLLTHVRTITVEPAPDPVFLDLPEDMTLNCGQPYEDPPSLNFSNGLQGICIIQGEVQATVVQLDNVYTHTWTFNHPCTGEVYEYTQQVTLSPDLSISMDPTEISLCVGDGYNLGLIDVIDNNGQDFELEYYAGFPSTPGAQLFDLNVYPEVSSLYTIRIFNDLGCEEELLFTINVDEPPYAGEDGSIELCVPGLVNLVEELGDGYTPGGTWLDIDGANVNLDNPEAIFIGSQSPGVYNFLYTVESGNTCPADNAMVSVNYFELIPIEIDTIYCTNNNSSYVVELQSFGSTISTTAGDVEQGQNGMVLVNDIPIDEPVTITFFDPVNLCVDFINLNPPNCNCPQVEPPTAMNVSVCESDGQATLYGEYEEGLILHWFENPNDDTPIQSGVDSLVVTFDQAGLYTYYLQTESIEFPGCFSAIMTEVSLEVIASPPVQDIIQVRFCYYDENEGITFDLTNFNTIINNNPDNTFEYFHTLEEAYAQTGGFTEVTLSSTDSIYVRVTNVFGCFELLGFEVVLYPKPNIEIEVNNPLCLNDPGNLVITAPEDLDNYSFYLDGEEVVYPDDFQNLFPDSYNLILTNQESTCSDTTTFEILEGEELLINSINYTCDDNGTGTDSTDDFYTVEFQIENTNVNATQFLLFVDGEEIGSYEYGVLNSVEIPANGNQVLLEFIDQLSSCAISIESVQLNSCSTNCEISLDSYETSCSTNGTVSDPLDDIITITIQASSINGSSEYVVEINNVATYVYEYGQEYEFQLPADGSIPTIVLIDANDAQCQLILDVNPLDPCSSSCSLSIMNEEIICFNNDTEDIFDDDFYTIEFDVTLFNGSNSGLVNLYVDGNDEGKNDINNISFTLPADGELHTIIVQDPDSLLCSDTLDIGPLVPCSSPCSINFDFFEYSCDNNGTGLDSSDDFITIQWNASAIDGSLANLYGAYIEGELIGVYSYGDAISHMITDLTGETVEFMLVDTEIESCIISEDINLNSCSFDCEIQVQVSNIICDNNGTNNTDEDDVFFATIFIEGTNTSAFWSFQNEVETYEYNSTIELGPFLISDGNVSFIIEDSENNSCPFILDLSPPNTCSECVQSVSTTDSILIDCSSTLATLIGESSEVGDYSWTGPQGFISSDSVTTSGVVGWHYFEVTYPDGCYNIDSTLIYSDQEIPTAFAGIDTVLTCSTSEIWLVGDFISTGTTELYWEDIDGNQLTTNDSLLVTESGFYYFYVYNPETGCLSAPDEVFVGLDVEEPDAAIFVNPNNILDCKVEQITLSHEFQENVVYVWNYNSNYSSEATFEIDTSGIVILTATDTVSGCFSIDSVEIQELEDFPVINVEPLETINCENQDVELDASNSIPSISTIFEWTNSAGEIISQESSVSVQDSGYYYLLVVDTVSGCENMDTLYVNANLDNASIQASEDIIFNCTDTEATLLVSSDSDGSFFWTTLDGSIESSPSESSIEISSAGSYIVEFIDANSLCPSYDTVIVSEQFNQLELYNWSSENESCFEQGDGVIVLGNINGGTEPYEILLNSIEIDQQDLSNLVPGDYSLSITDAEGCTKDTSFTIQAAILQSVDAPEEIVINLGDNANLNVITTIPDNKIDTIIWSPNLFLDCVNCLDNITNTTENIDYEVTIIDINGCEVSTIISIRIEEIDNIYAPNVITPDDNGVNDFFTIFTNVEMNISELAIYNRWGERVFYTENIPSNEPSLGWNGTFKGETVNPGVFAFYAIIELPDNKGFERITGDVTVLK